MDILLYVRTREELLHPLVDDAVELLFVVHEEVHLPADELPRGTLSSARLGCGCQHSVVALLALFVVRRQVLVHGCVEMGFFSGCKDTLFFQNRLCISVQILCKTGQNTDFWAFFGQQLGIFGRKAGLSRVFQQCECFFVSSATLPPFIAFLFLFPT